MFPVENHSHKINIIPTFVRIPPSSSGSSLEFPPPGAAFPTASSPVSAAPANASAVRTVPALSSAAAGGLGTRTSSRSCRNAYFAAESISSVG